MIGANDPRNPQCVCDDGEAAHEHSTDRQERVQEACDSKGNRQAIVEEGESEVLTDDPRGSPGEIKDLEKLDGISGSVSGHTDAKAACLQTLSVHICSLDPRHWTKKNSG